MRKHHPQNERIKRRYLLYLKDAKRRSEKTVDQTAAALAQFEAANNYSDFRKFHIEWARRFKRVLEDHLNPETGRPLAKATIKSRLMAVKSFVQWLADQPGYRSRVRYADAEYFNPSANDDRIARATREKEPPSLEQIRHVLRAMPIESDIQRRDRALIAFTILSGARDDAIASLSLKHVDLERRTVFQDAREVRTKNAKTIHSVFFPVGDDIEAIVTDWVTHLKNELRFGLDDPLFPSTNRGIGANGLFEAQGLTCEHWNSADAIRRIFREAFTAAGLPYFNPHSFRKTLGALGERLCFSAEAMKAWSQNFGHNSVMTTLTSYGTLSLTRQAEILHGLRGQDEGTGGGDQPVNAETVQRVLAQLQRQVSR